MKFKYGDSWEKYPIQDGETWQDATTMSMVSVCDITKDLPSWMGDADMVYCDPPWNTGNVNSFYTKAEKAGYIDDFRQFSDALFTRIESISPAVCYLEIGKQNLPVFQREMERLYPAVQSWKIKYYKKHVCYLIRGGSEFIGFDYTWMDDTQTPESAIKNERPICVADLCTGQGLTAIGAYRLGKRFVGTELNRRRLAVTIDRVNKLGGKYEGPVS